MTIRTLHSTVTFAQPFLIDGLADRQPAGEYRVDVDEEELEGLSFLAYRRVAALIHLPSLSRPQNSAQVITMAPAELDAMIERDGQVPLCL